MKLLGGSGSSSTAPTGSVAAYAGSAAPSGWLLCNGAAVSRTTYAALFAVVSTTYGVGDGSTTFNVPNLTGRSPMMIDAGGSGEIPTALGQTKGASTHTLDTTQIPAHTHTATGQGCTGAGGTATKSAPGDNVNADALAITVANTGGGLAHNNVQPVLGVNFIVKT